MGDEQGRCIPLLVGSPDEAAVIKPRDFLRRISRGGKRARVRMPKAGILTFAYDKRTNAAVQKQNALRKHEWFPCPLVDFKARGRRIGCATLKALGAPYAAVMVEFLAAVGLERLVLIGGVGVLSDELPRDSIIVPTDAIRDEGTSYHYVPAGRAVRSSEPLRARLLTACAKYGACPAVGKTWTTDAIFRETPRKVRTFREQGAVCVEMEAAACFAVAQHRGVELAALFRAGDSVAQRTWQPRTGRRERARASQDGAKLFEIAVEALCAR